MKKKMTNVLMVFALIFSVLTVCMPNAQAYDKNLYGDDNYILVYGHMDVAWYLDKSSVVVKQNDKNAHAFAQNIVIVDPTGKITKTKTYWYYQAVKRDNYNEALFSEDGEKWKSFDVNSEFGFMQVVVNGFKTGWSVAFGCGWS